MQPRSLRYKKEGPPVTLPTWQKLEALLDKLTVVAARSGPMMVKLRLPETGEMYIGLGHSRSVISYHPESPSKKDTPRVSLGEQRGEGVMYFQYCGRRWGFERRRTVKQQQAREAMLHFYRTGELLPTMSWETF